MKVEMSDDDYAVLRKAVEWIQEHAGNDAPDCPHIYLAAKVVENIGQRRSPDQAR